MMTKMNNLADYKLRLRQETFERFGREAEMLASPDQCEHMKFMVQLAGASKGIEVGVFTGYSALCLAEGLPNDGKLIALELNETYTQVA